MKVATTEAGALKWAAAVNPMTPREVRCMTANPYAITAVIHTTHVMATRRRGLDVVVLTWLMVRRSITPMRPEWPASVVEAAMTSFNG